MDISSRQLKSPASVLRTVAVLEAAKGVLVTCLGLGLVSLSHRHLGLESVAENLLYVLHIDPGWHISKIFLAAAARLGDTNLLMLAAIAAAYSMLRFVEGYGLWTGRVWAQWIALISGIMYLPLEIYELIRKPALAKWIILLINLAIVVYIAWLRSLGRSHFARRAGNRDNTGR